MVRPELSLQTAHPWIRTARVNQARVKSRVRPLSPSDGIGVFSQAQVPVTGPSPSSVQTAN